MSNEIACLVLDTGSGFCKAGLALDDYECVIEPTAIGRGKGADKGNLSYGENALRRKEYLDVSYPIQDGYIQSIDELEKFHEYLYSKKLIMKPQNFSLLIAYNSDDTPQNKLKTIEMFIERFHVPSFFAIDRLLLALYGHGIKRGMILDTGYESSRAVSAKDGDLIRYTQVESQIGGKHVTEWLRHLLMTRSGKKKAKKSRFYVNSIFFIELSESLF